jgi:hypothetical protein
MSAAGEDQDAHCDVVGDRRLPSISVCHHLCASGYLAPARNRDASKRHHRSSWPSVRTRLPLGPTPPGAQRPLDQGSLRSKPPVPLIVAQPASPVRRIAAVATWLLFDRRVVGGDLPIRPDPKLTPGAVLTTEAATPGHDALERTRQRQAGGSAACACVRWQAADRAGTAGNCYGLDRRL